MGRFSKAFCCCFGSSTYEIAPESDDFNTVILKNNNKTENDLTEKLLLKQSVQIEIKPKHQQDFQENIQENFAIKQQNQHFQEFLNLQQNDDFQTKFRATDTELLKINKQDNCNILQRNGNFQKFLNLQEKDVDDDDEDLKIKFNLKK